MAPRWAEKLDAQSRPSSNPLESNASAKGYTALFGFIALIGLIAGRWIASMIVRFNDVSLVSLITAVVILATGVSCWWIAKVGGWRAFGCAIFILTAFVGSILFHLLLATRP